MWSGHGENNSIGGSIDVRFFSFCRAGSKREASRD